MAVVYEHIRNDTNEVFYVGIGKTPKRAFSKKSRNPLWKNIVNKTDYTVEIIHNDVSWDEACELEKHLIFLFGRKNLGLGNLVNMTDGGEGTIGRTLSENTRKKISARNKGKTSHNKGKTLSDEHKRKIGIANKGKIMSDEQKQNLSEINTGKTHTEETRKKLSLFQRNKEGVKGYYFDKRDKKYYARIRYFA